MSGSSDTGGRITLQGLFRDWLSVDPLRGKRLATPPADLVAEVVGFPGVRLTAHQAGQAMNAVADRLAPTRPLLGWDEFNILALSGGAAGGAFGAGALVGLSKAGKRPNFAIVTGV
ncbi:MAG: patatin, partial [bacterium]|nr:patatin [bacterium]